MQVTDAAVVQLQLPSIIYPEGNSKLVRSRGIRNESNMDAELNQNSKSRRGE